MNHHTFAAIGITGACLDVLGWDRDDPLWFCSAILSVLAATV
jgi:hypothetical protein